MNKFVDINYLKSYLKARNLKPRDYMGQNFLIDEAVLAKIIFAADLKTDDVVLEVGPGLGVLTQELLPRVKEVIAVEKDPKLFEILRNDLKPFQETISNEVRDLAVNPETSRSARTGLTLINQDILRFHLDQNISGPYKVVANIPYYLTSKLFKYFLEQKNKPSLIVLMIQKEVGERVIASAGELSILGISVQIYADAEIAASVSRNSFWPVPEVDSVVLKITPKDKYPQIKNKKLFFQIVKKAFAGKRKQIKNTIGDIEALQKAEINPMSRPQDLTIDDWIRLYKLLVG